MTHLSLKPNFLCAQSNQFLSLTDLHLNEFHGLTTKTEKVEKRAKYDCTPLKFQNLPHILHDIPLASWSLPKFGHQSHFSSSSPKNFKFQIVKWL